MRTDAASSPPISSVPSATFAGPSIVQPAVDRPSNSGVSEAVCSAVSSGGGPVEASAAPAGALLTPGPAPRPRLRGWIHFWSFVVAMAACSALITVAATESSPLAVVATAVYSATVLGVFGVSALYHRVNWSTPGGRALVRRIDHSMIFLFIAGTYTPMTLLAMPPVPGIPVLVAVWVGALAGVMFATRKVDWSAVGKREPEHPSTSSG